MTWFGPRSTVRPGHRRYTAPMVHVHHPSDTTLRPRLRLPALLALVLTFASGLPLSGCRGCGGCKGEGDLTTRSAAAVLPGGLLRLVPRDVSYLLVVPSMGRFAGRLDSFVAGLERRKGKRRKGLSRFVADLGKDFGIDPLDPDSFKRAGLDHAKGLVLGLARVKGRRTAVFTVAVKDRSAFEASLRKLFKERYVSKGTSTTRVKGLKVVTAYGRDEFDRPYEDATYVVSGDRGVVVMDLEPREPPGPPSAGDSGATKGGGKGKGGSAVPKLPGHGLAAVRVLVGLAPAASAEGLLAHAWDKQGLRGEVLVLARRLPKRVRVRGALSTKRLQAMRKAAGFRRLIAAVEVGREGLQARAFLDLRAPWISELRKVLKSKAPPGEQINALERSASAVLRLSADPIALARLALSPKLSGVSFKQTMAVGSRMLGVDVEKELAPLLENTGMLAVYGTDRRLPRLVRRGLQLLPALLTYSVTARVKDRARAQELLSRLAAALKIRGRKVTLHPKKSGWPAKVYTIEAWQGTRSFWALSGSTFVYALGADAFGKAVAALGSSSRRLFKSKPPSHLTMARGLTAHVDLANLRRLLTGAGLGITVTGAADRLMGTFRGVRWLAVTLVPTEKGVELHGRLRLR